MIYVPGICGALVLGDPNPVVTGLHMIIAEGRYTAFGTWYHLHAAYLRVGSGFACMCENLHRGEH